MNFIEAPLIALERGFGVVENGLEDFGKGLERFCAYIDKRYPHLNDISGTVVGVSLALLFCPSLVGSPMTLMWNATYQ